MVGLLTACKYSLLSEANLQFEASAMDTEGECLLIGPFTLSQLQRVDHGLSRIPATSCAGYLPRSPFHHRSIPSLGLEKQREQ